MNQELAELKDQKRRGQINFTGRGIITSSRDTDPNKISSKASVIHAENIKVQQTIVMKGLDPQVTCSSRTKFKPILLKMSLLS